jgi:predicted transcriptional regulator
MLFEAVTVLLLIIMVFVLYVMVAGGGQGSSGWQVTVNGTISSMYAGDDDTLYAFAGNTIYAIGKNGDLNWQLSIPENWTLCGKWATPAYDKATNAYGFDSRSGPVVASKNGILYVFMKKNLTSPDGASVNESEASYNEDLLAVSPSGKILWEHMTTGQTKSVSGDAWLDNPGIYADSERVYLFHDYTETVFGQNGTFLWGIGPVSDPAAVDEAGNAYLMYADENLDNYFASDYGYMYPTNWLEAYYPNGTWYWTRTPDGNASRQTDMETGSTFGTLPIYHNGMLYVPLDDGITAFDTKGNVLWSRHYNASDFQFKTYCDSRGVIHQTTGEFKLFEQMPFDAAGNVYLECFDPINGDAYLCAIGPDGKDVSPVTKLEDSGTADFLWLGGAVNGQAYYVYRPWSGIALKNFERNVDNINSLQVSTIVARDARTGKDTWTYTPSMSSPATVTLNASNVRDLLSPSDAEEAIQYNLEKEHNATYYIPGILYYENTSMIPGNGVVYAHTVSYNFEYPVVFNESKCAYSNVLYELDRNGTLIWQKPVGSQVTLMEAKNGTVYYSTEDGKVNAAKIDAAAGIALLAIGYVLIRFCFIGSVARAKGRLNTNENRNAVYDFVLENPGPTLYDISRSMGMNIGTVRYHLFILRMNHRIVEHHSDVKYVRYFTNSGSYSKEEQAAVSMVRREGMRKILRLLIERPGLSNMQISQALDIPESSVCRYMKELSDKRIVTKEPVYGGSYAYSIQDAQKERIAGAMERLKSE